MQFKKIVWDWTTPSCLEILLGFFTKYVENLEKENAALKNEITLLKRRLQSANDRLNTNDQAKSKTQCPNDQAANGQGFSILELAWITRQVSHYADFIQQYKLEKLLISTVAQLAIFKKLLFSTVAKKSKTKKILSCDCNFAVII